MRRSLLLGALAGVALSAWGGEIIFVDPAHEKAQTLQQDGGQQRHGHEQLRERVLDDARMRSGREAVPPMSDEESVSPAGDRAREARDRLNDRPAIQTTVILKSGVPPTEAAKARQAARAWAAPAAKTGGNRCQTENTVGGIEGSAQGHTVIQGNTTGVTTMCK